MRRFFLFLILAFVLFVGNSYANDLLISAAMGTKDLVSKIGADFQRKTGVNVAFNFSSSGRLAKQIEAGAPADVYISASKFWMNYLLKKGFIFPSTAKPFASTKLVLVVPLNSHITSITEARKIAVGNRLAPVGKYAIETLKNLGIYDELKNKLIYAPTVRQISVWVMTGNADAGIIYYSDYVKFKNKLKLLKVFPDRLHEPITFWVGIVKGTRNYSKAKRFENFIFNTKDKVFERFGFEKLSGDKQ